MSHITKTPAGTWRANWRDPAGRQRAKTFPTKKASSGFLAEIEAATNRGLYLDPHAGRALFGPYAKRWLAARNVERTTAARDASLMGTHVLTRWADVPMVKIDNMAVQTWVTELGAKRSPATVRACFRLLKSVLSAAVRDRLLGANPCDAVRLPRIRKKDSDGQTITPTELTGQLLPAVPERYRGLVALAGGTGLRWGECVGLRWESVDLDANVVHVVRVAVEVAGSVTTKPFPKSRAGRRAVPLPPFVVAQLVRHRADFPPGPAGEVFTNEAGTPVRRTAFRSRVWRPSLVRAGLLGKVVEVGPSCWRARWTDATGAESTADFATEREAVAHVVKTAAGGLRTHDLRHSYATWLVSRGVPVNDVQRVMGHENPSTTLNLYTHRSSHQDQSVREALADFSLTEPTPDDPEDENRPDA
jgi:integrase